MNKGCLETAPTYAHLLVRCASFSPGWAILAAWGESRGKKVYASIGRFKFALIILALMSLISCAPHKKHDHSFFGPTNKDSGTGYGYNYP
jgi:hypothetical protein